MLVLVQEVLSERGQKRRGLHNGAWPLLIMPSRFLLPLLTFVDRAAADCPSWCEHFVCDGSSWCQNGERPAPCQDCTAVTPPSYSCDNDARCTSLGGDCCAPSSLAEEATCSGGFVPVRTGRGCFDFTDGAYVCCTSNAPPPNPSPPPHPQWSAGGSAVDRINSRFRNARPSSDLTEAGVLLHQFDEIEMHGRPWEFCEGTCYTQGATLPGRVSAMIIYHGLRDRGDRAGIPLPFGDRGGLIFRPTEVELKCLYGVDGSTAFQRNDPNHPGCPAPGEFCDAAHPEFQYGGMCGFNGWPIGAWKPHDLKPFLEAHSLHGAPYHAPVSWARLEPTRPIPCDSNPLGPSH